MTGIDICFYKAGMLFIHRTKYRIMKRWILALTLMVAGQCLTAQTLIGYEFVRTYTRGEIDLTASLLGFAYKADNGVDIFRVLYHSTGSDGTMDTLSGMVAIPSERVTPLPMLLFQHGTTDGRYDVPSTGELFNVLLELGFAGKGFVVSSADYVGLGVSRGFHPYVHAETEASAGIDMAFAAQEVCGMEQVDLSDYFFVSGYSQGGHASMAAHRELQRRGGPINVTGSAPMSGPYSISTEMKSLILSDEEYFTSAYLPYVLAGFQTVYGNLYQEYSEVYREPYASIIREEFAKPDYSITFLSDTLNATLLQLEGAVRPKRIYQDSILDGVANNPDHRINVALRANDVYDWAPEVPMRLFYCEADEQVVYTKSLFADSVMTLRGAPDVHAVSVGSQFTHRACAPYAMGAAIDFFKGLMTTPTDNFAEDAQWLVYPVPADDHIMIEVSGDRSGSRVEVLDLSGKLMDQFVMGSGTTSRSVSALPAGSYILKIHAEGAVVIRRFLKI